MSEFLRDNLNIICIYDQENKRLDAGDAPRATGPSALKNKIDHDNLARFLKFVLENGKLKFVGLVRHPIQNIIAKDAKYAYNDERSTSRDQLIGYCVAFHSEYVKAVAGYFCKKWFINKDFLNPAVRLYLHVCAEIEPSRSLKVIGRFWMNLEMWWNTKKRPDHEMNQFACMCIKLGGYWSHRLLTEHPNLRKNLEDYWNVPWRNQGEIAEILLWALQQQAAVYINYMTKAQNG